MVGSTIKKIRQRKKLTQNDLAQWLGVSRQAVAMWEIGRREVKITTLKKIAHVFGVSVNEIITPKNNRLTKKEESMSKKNNQKKKVVFELMAPTAKKVLLAGDFNSWSDNGIVMRRNKNGVWKTDVELNAGVYEYKFIVDNQWWTDPKNDMKVDNQLGDLNSVLKVSA
jgi:transcriptional regulator with XRE-family HTH domain